MQQGDVMRRKRIQRKIDRGLLDAIFIHEAEWKNLQSIVEKSIEPMDESRHKLSLAQAKYMYLLKEAKRRKISYLRY